MGFKEEIVSYRAEMVAVHDRILYRMKKCSTAEEECDIQELKVLQARVDLAEAKMKVEQENHV